MSNETTTIDLAARALLGAFLASLSGSAAEARPMGPIRL